MNRRSIGVAGLTGVVAVAFAVFAMSAPAAKRAPHIGSSTQPSTSKMQGKRGLVVGGTVVSAQARCERQRSVLLYEVNQSGDFLGAAIGHATTDGAGAKGEFSLVGDTKKKISPTREFRVETVARNVKIKGKEYICKRSVSIPFRATYP